MNNLFNVTHEISRVCWRISKFGICVNLLVGKNAMFVYFNLG